MQMIRSGDNRKTQLLSQLDQKNFFSVQPRCHGTAEEKQLAPKISHTDSLPWNRLYTDSLLELNKCPIVSMTLTETKLNGN